jgi:hypothetical protein
MNRRVAGLHVWVSEPTTLQPTAGFARVLLKSAQEARLVWVAKIDIYPARVASPLQPGCPGASRSIHTSMPQTYPLSTAPVLFPSLPPFIILASTRPLRDLLHMLRAGCRSGVALHVCSGSALFQSWSNNNPVTLTEDSRGFPESCQANDEIGP